MVKMHKYHIVHFLKNGLLDLKMLHYFVKMKKIYKVMMFKIQRMN